MFPKNQETPTVFLLLIRPVRDIAKFCSSILIEIGISHFPIDSNGSCHVPVLLPLERRRYMRGQAGLLRVVILVIVILIGLDKWREIG